METTESTATDLDFLPSMERLFDNHRKSGIKSRLVAKEKDQLNGYRVTIRYKSDCFCIIEASSSDIEKIKDLK